MRWGHGRGQVCVSGGRLYYNARSYYLTTATIYRSRTRTRTSERSLARGVIRARDNYGRSVKIDAWDRKDQTWGCSLLSWWDPSKCDPVRMASAVTKKFDIEGGESKLSKNQEKSESVRGRDLLRTPRVLRKQELLRTPRVFRRQSLPQNPGVLRGRAFKSSRRPVVTASRCPRGAPVFHSWSVSC